MDDWNSDGHVLVHKLYFFFFYFCLPSMAQLSKPNILQGAQVTIILISVQLLENLHRQKCQLG